MKNEEITRPTKSNWGNEIATASNDPEIVEIYDNLLEQGDSILRDLNDSIRPYYEVWADDQVISTFNQRKRAVLSAPVSIEPGGSDDIDIKAANEFRENMKLLDMDDMTDKQLNALFFGYMVQENIWVPNGSSIWLKDVKTRKPERFLFDTDHNIRLLTKDKPVKGISTEPVYFWAFTCGAITHDNPYGLGIGYYVYWLNRFKKMGLKFWLKYLERFAQPTMVAKFPASAGPEDINTLLNTITSLASDFGAVIPEDMNIEMVEATRSGTADYRALRDIINSAISKIIVGQTMTTDNGASNAQSRTHQKTKTDVAMSDGDMWASAFTRNVAKTWTELNYPGAKVPVVKRDVEPKQSTIEMARTDKEIAALGWELTPEKFKEKYGEGYQKMQNPNVTSGNSGNRFLEDERIGGEVPVEEDTVQDFAETLSGQDMLDKMVDLYMDERGQGITEEMLSSVFEFAQSHSPEETLEALPELIGEHEFEILHESLRETMAGASVIGYENE